MASYEDLSNLELRKKLLDFGYDLPVSINRDFLIKKLRQAAEAKVAEKSSTSVSSRRKSSAVPQNPSKNKSINPSASSTPEVKSKNRFSLNDIDNRPSTSTLNDRPVVNSQQSHRYSTYLNYFKGNTSDGDPSVSQFNSRDEFQSGSGYARHSLAANFSHQPVSENLLDRSRDSNTYNYDHQFQTPCPETTSGVRFKERAAKVFGAVNPINWVKYVRQSWTTSRPTKTNTGEPWLNNSSGYSSGSPQFSTRFPSSPMPPLSVNNGHWSGGGTAGGSSSSRMYSPTVPPGRQAGFKAFFTKQRNGVSDRHSQSSPSTSDWENSPKVSKILVAGLILFFVVVGGLYINQIRSHSGATKTLAASGDVKQESIVKSAVKTPPVATKARYPICGMPDVDNQVCVEKQYVKDSRKLFQLLKDELVQRARKKGCGTEVEDKITLRKARTLLYGLSDMQKVDVDNAFQGMLILCHVNRNWGLKIEIGDERPYEEIETNEIMLSDYNTTTITAVDVYPNLICLLWSGIYLIASYAFILLLVTCVLMVAYKCYTYYRRQKKEEEAELFEYVERIITLLYNRYEAVKDSGEDSFLAVSHIRDQLVNPRDRMKKTKLWTKVVNYISTNESRVREEVQHISGEEYRVWRWLPSASPLSRQTAPPSSYMRHSLVVQQQPSPTQSLYPSLNDMSMNMSMSPGSNLNNKWQGQAFEISDCSPNALPVTPTTCLKIRQMFDTETNSSESGQSRIERAILEKCNDSRILHIGVDSQSSEGCVYVKCVTREDARNAYKSLHGWWFDGHLLSVKFLREERYVARFPESRNNTVPMALGFYPQQSTSFSVPSSSRHKSMNKMNLHQD